MNRLVNDELKRPSEVITEIPENIDKAGMKTMSLNYKEIFQTADEFAQALDTDNTASVSGLISPLRFSVFAAEKAYVFIS